MSLILKENGHRVSPVGRIGFSQKNHTKEAYDVHTQYSKLFSISSNPDCTTIRFTQSYKGLDQSRPGQAIPSRMPSLRQCIQSDPQLGGASDSRLEFWIGTDMAAVSVSQDFLFSMSANRDRRPGTLRSLEAGQQKACPLYTRTLQGVDRQGSGRSSGIELEDHQEGRQARILAVDEIAIRKGHHYLTVVLDYLSGRVVWVGKHRRVSTLIRFFNLMPKKNRKALEAIVMDMWDPYILVVMKKVPHVKVVFDLFHVVSQFSRVIDKVRNAEYRKASEKNKEVFKGARYLLLKNRSNIRRTKDREQLKQLLELNEVINTVLILKDKLKHIWSYRSRTWASKAIDEWGALARCIDHPEVNKFAKMLDKYRYGILNHCDYPIHTGKLEGVNNKIKVIKRKAYGYHDIRYFSLKIIQAFTN